jgi:hypothetical protein
MVALVIFPVAAVLVSRSVRVKEPGRGAVGALMVLAMSSAVSLALFMGSLVPVFVRPGPPILLGLTERLLFVSYLAWLAVAATWLLRSCDTGWPSRAATFISAYRSRRQSGSRTSTVRHSAADDYKG